jgi:hypothetical protein
MREWQRLQVQMELAQAECSASTVVQPHQHGRQLMREALASHGQAGQVLKTLQRMRRRERGDQGEKCLHYWLVAQLLQMMNELISARRMKRRKRRE